MAKLSVIRSLWVLLVVLVVLTSAQQSGGKRRQQGQQQGQKQRPAANVPQDQNQKPEPQKNDDKGPRLFTATVPKLGRIRGRIVKTQWSGKDIFQFLDIPYGESPVGPLRFKPPVPAEPWTDVLKANKPHPGCPSVQNIDAYNALGEKKLRKLKKMNIDIEDCLRLTINSKDLSGKAAVMVYIHGDFLYDGSSIEAAPGYLLEENVVLVSLRYRLGPFGFLSTMTEDIPGNAAVHDVVLALQWIQKHIAAFGGDPKRVTLFGQVGGSALINVLTMSPIVPGGLFHRVIYHSGSALSPAFITDSPLAASKDIAKIAGCKHVGKVDALNKCLRSLNTTALLEAFSTHGNTKASQGIGSYGAVQFVIGGPSGVLPQHPGKLLAAEKFKAYPTMGGSVKNAGTFILKDIYIDNFNETIIDDKFNGLGYIDYIIAQTNGADPTGAWKQYAQEEIFSPADIKNGSFYKMIPGLVDMCSTIAFKNPVLLAMQANAKKLPNNTYLYSFDYAGELNRYETSDYSEGSNIPFDLGVSLTDENLYLFPWPRYNRLNSNRDIKIAKRMVYLWTSFARRGVPSAPGLEPWPAMTEDTGPYLKIDKTVSVADNFLDEYSIAVKDVKMGYNLVNEDFFESLEEIVEGEDEDDDDDDEEEGDQHEGRGKQETFVLIARKTKRNH